jgi:hypothetical protein
MEERSPSYRLEVEVRACPVTVSGLYGGTGEAAGHDDDH